ncbi:MAG: phage portal protein [Gemmatimonadaceae bacterium]|nr:phage portal protein [Gemmatimonadaceae bacterium]
MSRVARVPGFEPTSLAPRRVAPAVGFLRVGGGYDGARSDRRALQDWNVLDGGPNTDSLGDLPNLRARSLDLERNAPLAAGAFNTQLRDVLGDGLVPKPRLDREYLDLTAEEATAWSRQAMRIWWQHAGSTRLDVAGRLHFSELQRQALFASLSGGDAFALFRYRVDAGDLLGTKVQVLEANRCSQPVAKMETELFREGVEVNADGVVQRFWISNRHPNEQWLSPGGVITWEGLPARDASGFPLVLQLIDQKRPGQLRGIPYLAPVIETLKNLTRFSEAELMAAVVSSMFTVFVKGGFAPGLGELDDEDPSPKGQIKLGTGAIIDLGADEDVEFANPARPNAQFDPFFLAMCRQLGAALEIPYEQLVNAFQASYSASRAALLNAWRAVRTRRNWFVNQFCQPVYARVIREAVARGLLQAPGFFDDPLAQAAWLGCEWTGPSMPEIDPVKAVVAASMRVKEGFSTRERESAELTSTDYDENFEQRVAEEERRRAAGLDVEDVAERVRTEPVTPEAPAKDGDGDEGDEELPKAGRARVRRAARDPLARIREQAAAQVVARAVADAPDSDLETVS